MAVPERSLGEHYDVAVIGGGIAGVSIAYELAADRSVVLLEQEDQLAVHTTGRSAAVFAPTYGNEVVRALTRASRTDLDRIRERFATSPLLTPRQLLWVATESTPATRAALATVGDTPVDVADLPRHCPILRPDAFAAATLLDAMDLDVMALHGAYVRGLRARGGTIRRSFPARELRHLGDRWQVGDGEVTLDAEVVVNAAGAWADQVAERAGATPMGLRPLRRTLFVTPLDGHDTAGWPFVVDVQERFYFKPEGAALLVSPGDETPDKPGDARHDEVDVARTLEVVDQLTTVPLRRVTAAWAGLRTFAPDRSPVVGPDVEADGFVWFAGQGGYGIQMAAALARVGAALVRGEDIPDDVARQGVTAADLAPDRFAS